MTDLLQDPQEQLPSFRKLLRQVEAQALAQCFPGEERPPFGGCHALWATMEDILWREHGIRWRSPSEMNPTVSFD